MVTNPDVLRYFQLLGEKKYKEAEELLRILKGGIDTSKKGKGYWQALEGLLLTSKTNDEKNLYLPKVTVSKEDLEEARREFMGHAKNPLHDDYDRGYFEALLDYLEVLSLHIEGKGQ